MHRRDILLGGLGLALSGTESANAIAQQAGQKRFALILANQTYEKNPLPNIDNDASLMAKTLTGLGFSVSTLMNGSLSTMRTRIAEHRYILSKNPGGISIVYYTGHAVQVDDENYLVPVNNGALMSETDVKLDCLSLAFVLDMSICMQGNSYITILDACRDNPLPEGGSLSFRAGIAPVTRKLRNSLVACAATSGGVASSNPSGKNSLFTEELVKNLPSGLPLEDVFRVTRKAVYERSGGKQVPEEFGTLTTQVFLAGGPIWTGNNNPEVKLSPTEIRLEVIGVPAGGKVTVDGIALSGTIYTDEIADKTKEVEVSVAAAGFRPYVRKVTLTRSSASTLRVVMEAKVPRSTDYPRLTAYVESLRPIPAGTFQMGSSTGRPDEKPVHSVTLSAYRMGATPVTAAVWKEYCAATGTKLPEAPSWGFLDDHPVVNVSWNDIMGVDGKSGFCAWASEIAGFCLALPTEAQFEYAACGGQSRLVYPWGNIFDRSKLWCSGPSEPTSTAPVTRTSNLFRNAYGLTDMSGNVWQWCSDWYGPYSSTSQTDPQGPSSSSENRRCVRGGSWYSDFPDFFRCANRGGGSPDSRDNVSGFRLSAGPG